MKLHESGQGLAVSAGVALRLLLCVFALGTPLFGAGSFLNAPVQLTANVQQYTRADFQVDVAASYSNPYDQRQVAVDMILTSPSGKTLVLPVFFENGQAAHSVWKARFSAQETGRYRYLFRLTEGGSVSEETAPLSFDASASDKDGFLHANDYWTFKYDSGRPFRGLGENVGWEGRTWDSSAYSYDLFLPELAQNGASFFRTWSCSWNLPLEWKKVSDTNRYSNSTEQFNPGGVQRLDQLVELCEKLKLHFMLAFDHHGGLLAGDKWPRNNYNTINGGPCASPADFFTNPEARAMYKNRLRYIVARWGCYPSIGAWELFNEVDNAVFTGTGAIVIPPASVTAWHAEMSAYLKQIDPYGHLVTTSISWQDVPGIYDIGTIDFNQRHTYNNTATIPAVIGKYIDAKMKPFVDGEFSWDWDWNHFAESNWPSFIYDYKFGMWYGLFSPTPVVPMSWWWEFNHERGVIPYMQGIRAISDRMLAAGNGSFQSLPSTSSRLHTMAVQCGKTIFVHAHNTGLSPVIDDIKIAVSETGTFSLESFDPETRTSTKAGFLTPSGGFLILPALSLQSHEQRVFVLSQDAPAPAPDGTLRMVALSTRSLVGSGDSIQIGGFVIGGSTPKKVIIRAAGPALKELGVPNVLNDPLLRLFSGGTEIGRNDDWDPALAPAFAGVGARAWAPGSKDAALVVTLAPGGYTALVSGKDGSDGVAIIEVFDADGPVSASSLVAISTRSPVGTVDDILFAGFVIQGSAPKTVIIRAAGPALKQLGDANLLADPILELFSGQTRIARNDDWDSALALHFSKVHLSPWTAGSKDAALIVTLDPGGYTAQVSGKDGGKGVAIVEVYELN